MSDTRKPRRYSTQSTATRSEIIAALTELGATMCGPGYGPFIKQWAERRPASMPGASVTVRKVTGKLVYQNDRHTVDGETWQAMITGLGLKNPKKGYNSKNGTAPRTGAVWDNTGADDVDDLRKYEIEERRLQNTVATTGWQERTIYHPARRVWIKTWIAVCM